MLAQQREVPADATAVIIAGPQHRLPAARDRRAQAIRRAGRQGDGHARSAGAREPDAAAGLVGFLNEWGIQVGNDIVLDASGIGQLLGTDASVPVAAPPYPPHAITDRFNVMTAFPLARSVKPVEGGTGGHTAQPFRADQRAELGRRPTSRAFRRAVRWNSTPIRATSKVRSARRRRLGAGHRRARAAPDQRQCRRAAGAAKAGVDASSRSAIPDFAANYGLGIQGNRDLFLNALNWMAQNENLIAIRPREAEDRRITLTQDQHQRIMLLSLLIVPGLVLAAGVYTWWRRR